MISSLNRITTTTDELVAALLENLFNQEKSKFMAIPQEKQDLYCLKYFDEKVDRIYPENSKLFNSDCKTGVCGEL